MVAVPSTPNIFAHQHGAPYADGDMVSAFARWLIASLLAASAVAAGTPATALFDFSSHEPDELSLRRGEALTVLDPEAAGEEGWAFGQTADGRQGLLPLSYVRLEPSAASTEPARQRVEVTAAGAVGSSWPEPSGPGAPEQDPAVAEAMWRYRNRRAAYNGPAELLERWGVSLELEAAGLPLASDAGGAPCGKAAAQRLRLIRPPARPVSARSSSGRPPRHFRAIRLYTMKYLDR